MKIKGMEGEYAFQYLYRMTIDSPWYLSDTYFLTQKEVINYIELQKRNEYVEFQAIWPVEVQDGQVVYIPAQEELE